MTPTQQRNIINRLAAEQITKTTAMVAWQLQRNFIGFELNPDYIKIAERNRLACVQQRIV